MGHSEFRATLKVLREFGVTSAAFGPDGALTQVTLGDPPAPPPARGIHAKRQEEAAEPDDDDGDPRFLLERIHAANAREAAR